MSVGKNLSKGADSAGGAVKSCRFYVYLHTMDINLLSEEAYTAVISEAEQFDDDLALHFEFLSEVSDDEQSYLEKAAALAKDILKFDDEELEDLFYGNSPDKEELYAALHTLLDNINAVLEIPFDQRTFNEA